MLCYVFFSSCMMMMAVRARSKGLANPRTSYTHTHTHTHSCLTSSCPYPHPLSPVQCHICSSCAEFEFENHAYRLCRLQLVPPGPPPAPSTPDPLAPPPSFPPPLLAPPLPPPTPGTHGGTCCNTRGQARGAGGGVLQVGSIGLWPSRPCMQGRPRGTTG